MKVTFVLPIIGLLLLLVVFVLFQSWVGKGKQVKPNIKHGTQTVEIRKMNGQYQLYRHGKPYYIRGGAGYQYLDKIRENGGNSIRTWDAYNAQRILDEAQQQGLTVTLGLSIGSPRQGFDYTDEAAVARQLKEIRKTVLQYKDHPALLMWGIGNEVTFLLGRRYPRYFRRRPVNIKIWKSINDIAAMIHEVDPNHPTTTMLNGISQYAVNDIKDYCPNLDIISINTFGALTHLLGSIQLSGWEGPYVVSEWGPSGYWELPRTDWDAFIEETSTQKANDLLDRYAVSMAKDKNCLGSYVFYWGVKQERTHTLFSLFLNSGEATGSVDAIHYLWTGRPPANRSPQVDILRINGKQATDNVVLTAATTHVATIQATDADGDSLQYRWEILPDLTGAALNEGGDKEIKPAAIPGLIKQVSQGTLTFKAPNKAGAYRLYSYVLDGRNKVATANIPFYVMP